MTSHYFHINASYNCLGYLKKQYYQVYANYLVKFLEGYRKNGVEIWAITTGNEPTIYYEIHTRVISMGWTPTDMANWIASFMGPTLVKSGHNDTLILALDDDKFLLPGYVVPTYTDNKSNKYTAGTAVHAYFENYAPASVLTETHDAFPNKFILMTEDSIGELSSSEKCDYCEEHSNFTPYLCRAIDMGRQRSGDKILELWRNIYVKYNGGKRTIL